MTYTTCEINKSNIDYYRDLLIGKIFTIWLVSQKDNMEHIFNINRNQKIFWTNDPTSFGPFVYGLIDILNNSIENEYYVKGYAMKIEK